MESVTLKAIGSVTSSAGKHAVEWLTKAVAIASGASNTRAIAGCPTTVKTEPLTKIKLGRPDRAEDIKGAVSSPALGVVPIRSAGLLVGGGWTVE